MLTAIQDFVRDSFDAESDDVLDTLQIGGLNVLVERSPRTILAAVVRGVPPTDLRYRLQETLEQFHHRHGDELKAFSGDSTPFERSLPLLNHCMLSRRRDEGASTAGLRWRRVAGWTVAAITLAAVLVWSFVSWQEGREWARYVDRLQQEPGIVITSQARKSIAGMRDQLSADPVIVLTEFDFESEEVESNWHTFVSTDPEITRRRVESLLEPPAHLSIHISNGHLAATGLGASVWLRQVRDQALALPGVLGVDEAEGRTEIDQIAGGIENERFSYATGRMQILEEDQSRFSALVSRLDSLQTIGRQLGTPVRVEVRGHASPDGPALVNLQISQLRADEFRRLLVSALGARQDPEFLDIVAVGMGAVDQRTARETGGGRFVELRVTFERIQN
jgi:OOP family OmpA-OmpF porin